MDLNNNNNKKEIKKRTVLLLARHYLVGFVQRVIGNDGRVKKEEAIGVIENDNEDLYFLYLLATARATIITKEKKIP